MWNLILKYIFCAPAKRMHNLRVHNRGMTDEDVIRLAIRDVIRFAQDINEWREKHVAEKAEERAAEERAAIEAEERAAERAAAARQRAEAAARGDAWAQPGSQMRPPCKPRSGKVKRPYPKFTPPPRVATMASVFNAKGADAAMD